MCKTEMKKLLGSAGVITALVLGVVNVGTAQVAGDTVYFLLPEAGTQPVPPEGPKDKLIITGGKITTTDITGCGGGTRPVQNAVLVDPDATRSGRIVGVIIHSQTDPIHPGTKLKDLSVDSSCTTGGTAYIRYSGTVQ
jgi:hypothetical protein